MTIRELQDEIVREKRARGRLLLAHTYAKRELSEVADLTGDSFALARYAAGAQGDVVVCGVRFMAETVKLLLPERKVYLANENAGCPMAEQIEPEELAALKEEYPEAAVVAYINTSAALKAVCDVCVTSSSAEKIIARLPQKEILFVPDINLGRYLQKKLPEKTFHFVHGGCPTHLRARRADVEAARAAHPNALLLVHPECLPEVWERADYVGSTTGIMAFAKNSPAREFIIGTENTVLEHLQLDCAEKSFYPLCKDLVCHNMRLATLTDALACLRGERAEIVLDERVAKEAIRCVDAMIALGG